MIQRFGLQLSESEPQYSGKVLNATAFIKMTVLGGILYALPRIARGWYKLPVCLG